MKGKMIFFDIDGTLLDHDKRLPDSTRQAVRELKEKGHSVAIATGRGPFMYKELREELGIDSYVSYNGQYVVWQGKPLYTNPIRPELLDSVTEYAVRHNHPIVYMDHDTMRSNTEYHAYVEESIGTLKVAQPSFDPKYHLGREIYQCLLFCTIGEEQAYKDTFGELDFIRWHQFSMDILPAGGSKAKGIEKMIEKLGIDRSDVYAFGDHLNDLEMLQFAGTGVAMGNALDSVKKIAKVVTRAVDDDGIWHGLKQVGLL
ncbi:Cof-type HAD-IIB family hydrolase [Paenibacillus aurantius]|uniref:Cof-type HAD-IIB family hydrolase n=1 Tax=Paenibacillus aurantius TaxID=2918900 RepID=A0AA96RC21_9BACL|nr:Cof-type HAD-IIB family hydrolase [Paenibacillus aurantius]WNQ10060.1 Cof-type HAD-IIB family hydrolase [Paenibacillus aurantius]